MTFHSYQSLPGQQEWKRNQTKKPKQKTRRAISTGLSSWATTQRAGLLKAQHMEKEKNRRMVILRTSQTKLILLALRSSSSLFSYLLYGKPWNFPTTSWRLFCFCQYCHITRPRCIFLLLVRHIRNLELPSAQCIIIQWLS